MPADKNIKNAADAAKKYAAAKAKKSALPKSSNPVVPKLGAMPKAIKNPYAKSSTKSSSGAPKTLPAVTSSKKGVRYAQ